MRLNNKNIENKVNSIVKNYIRNKIDIIEILDYYMKEDMERLTRIINRFQYAIYDEKNGIIDKSNPLSIEDIKDFRFYLNSMKIEDVDKEAKKRNLYIQGRLLDIIAEEAMASNLEAILTDYEDDLSLQYMVDNDIICNTKYVESDLLYDERFGNPYSPFYIKYTWKEYQEMYFRNADEAEEYKYSLLSEDKAIYVGDTDVNRNTVCALVTLAIATAIVIMYEKYNIEDEGIELMEYMHSCMNSDANSSIIIDVLNDMCISSSIPDIIYFMGETIDDIFRIMYVDRDKNELLEYIDMYTEGEVVLQRIEYFVNEVFRDYVR